VYTTKMSTVGSASATGSIGGRTTTWASGSASGMGDDEMSMDTNFQEREGERDMDERSRYSASAMDEDFGDGMSDDTSLVGFGEGAGSTVSGPIYSRRDIGRSGLGSQVQSQTGGFGVGVSNPGTPMSDRTTATAEGQRRDARAIDGLADDTASGYVDTAARGGGVGGRTGVEAAERILRDRLDEGGSIRKPLGSPDEAGLGKFYFEERK
jgi:hypothetical protein